jgi:hypothetical protein
MIWYFVAASLLMVAIGAVMLLSPQKILFLMPDADKQRLLTGRVYRVVARLGGVLLIFVCAPLNLLVGFLFGGAFSSG